MSMPQETSKYILLARQMVMECKYKQAFDLLVAAFEQIPSLVPLHEKDFCMVLLMLNDMLDCQEKCLPLIFKNYSKALKIFPNNPVLLNDIGKYLYKYGCYKEALKQFRDVLRICPTFADAEKNINSLKNLLVERWHYRMLNDNLRNEYYRHAIHQTVQQKDIVLDVGTGTSLLAIYASEAGASRVVGCDGSAVMCNLANIIVRQNKVNKVTILNKMSMDLTPSDLNGRSSVLITEMFDAGLFGEHVLQMLAHAWPTLLSDTATVVPNSAEFFVVGVQCDHLASHYKLGTAAKSLLNIPMHNVHIVSQDECYDCEDLHLIEDIKYLTEPKSLMKVNFNNPDEIAALLQRTDPFQVDLVAKGDGVMNVVIGWFNLYLSETVTITTNPKSVERANAWQQAVFYDDISRSVQENEVINLNFLMNGGNLTMKHSSDGPITRASEEMIRFLNDNEYTNMIKCSVPIACQTLTQTYQMTELNVLDLCPFPLFGMEMLKTGAKSLTCCPSNDVERNFITNVFSANNIPMSKVCFKTVKDWFAEEFNDQKYHAVFSHILEVCGDLNVNRQEVDNHLRQNMLEDGGVVLPAQVNIVTQLVSSYWLDLNNRLYDENVSNYVMSQVINNYKVTQNFSTDLSTLKYVPISEPVVLCTFPIQTKHVEKLIRVISNGFANAILCWYNIQVITGLPEISTNRPTSLISGMLFLTYSKNQLVAGKMAKIVMHQDADFRFKMVMNSI